MSTATIQSSSLLPVYFQTSKNSKFLSSTIDQLIQQPKLERLNAFIGEQPPIKYTVTTSTASVTTYSTVDINEIVSSTGPYFSTEVIAPRKRGAFSQIATFQADDSFQGPYNLGFQWNMFGTLYDQVYIGTNGYLTFGGGNTNYTPVVVGVLSHPAIYAEYTDLWEGYGANGQPLDTGEAPGVFVEQGSIGNFKFFRMRFQGTHYILRNQTPTVPAFDYECTIYSDGVNQYVETIYETIPSTVQGLGPGDIGAVFGIADANSSGFGGKKVVVAPQSVLDNTSHVFYSTENGGDWQYAGQGSFSPVPQAEVIRTDISQYFVNTQTVTITSSTAYTDISKVPTWKSGDPYIQESSGLRQAYQLTPAMVTRDINGEIQSVTAIDDLANEIVAEGGYADNFDRLFRSYSYSYSPQIDWDKLINYQNYYWMPVGPKLIEFDQDNLDVATLVVGQSTATLSVGSYTIPLQNGMMISFTGIGVEEEYRFREFFVEGVGTAIQLIPIEELITPEAIAAPGVDFFDSENFDTYSFDNYRNMPLVPEYVTINRASQDRNSWSRYNRWVSFDVLQTSAKVNNEAVDVPAKYRAVRPIIEFKANIQLYNFGSTAMQPIDLIDSKSTDPFFSDGDGLGTVTIINSGSNYSLGTVITVGPPDTTAPVTKQASVRYSINTATGTIDTIQIGNVGAGYSNPYLTITTATAQTLTVTTNTNNTFAVNTNTNKNIFVGMRLIGSGIASNTRVTSITRANTNQYTISVSSPLTGNLVGNQINFIDIGNGAELLAARSSISGSIITEPDNLSSVQIDGVRLEYGHRIIFTSAVDLVVRNKIYKVDIENVDGINRISLMPDDDAIPYAGASVLAEQGATNGGSMWHFDGTHWSRSQQHTSINQAPLFDLFDENGNSLTNNAVFQTNFYGNKIFGYSINKDNPEDPVLNLRLNYRNLNLVGSFLFENYFSESKITQSDTNFTTQAVPANKTYILVDNNLTNVWGELIKAPIELNSTRYYDLPLSLTNNPLNGDINTFTLSDLAQHMATNTRLVANGVNPVAFAMMFIGKKTNSVIDAIDKSAEAYNYFKLSFINKITEKFRGYQEYNKGPILINFDKGVSADLDEILTELISNKTSQNAYYLSDMLATGPNKRTITYTVPAGSNNTTFALSSAFDPNSPSTAGVYIYLNTLLLTYGVDYEINTVDGTLTVNVKNQPLNTGDVLVIDEYFDTRGSFIPPTPTKLGLYPAYVPDIFYEQTYITRDSILGTLVICGHDGSIMPAFGDYRDNLILEYERRVYNNLKIYYNYGLFDINSVRPGAFRSTDYSLSEINSILESDFVKWSGQYGIDYALHDVFSGNDPLTWNYGTSYNKNFRFPVTGSWRSIFKYFYDTDQPHIAPWEMLGFISQPSWWVAQYGPAPYTSGNGVMWTDIENGYISQDDNLNFSYAAGVNPFYVRPGLSKILPVDDNGNLLDPLTIGLITSLDEQALSTDWAVGDEGPAETAWRRSSYWPFAVQRLLALTRPATYCAVNYDPYQMQINAADQWTYGDNNTFVQLNNMPIHGENGKATSGYSVFVSEIGQQRSQNYIAELRQDLQYVDFNLFHKVGGFVNQNTLQIIIDAYEPTTTAPGAVLPNESYKLILNSSNPILTVSASGMIIQRVGDNFVLRGYDRKTPYFKYYKSIRNQTTPTITVGGVSSSYVTWAPASTSGNTGLSPFQTTTAQSAPSTRFYQTGQIVQYGSNFYRVLTSHQAEAVFNNSFYQILPALPTVGGVTVQLASEFDKTVQSVPYGKTFTNAQDLYDVIVGYGKWLTDQGFIFDQFNEDLNVLNDWNLSSQEFLYWSTQRWDSTSVISISPFSDQVKFQQDNSVVDDIFNKFYEYSVARADGTPFPKTNLFIARQDKLFTVNTINTVDGIYLIRLNCIQKEHGMVFDNTDIFGDVIYDIQTGERQKRMKLVGFRTADWNGDFFSPGFVYDSATVVNWSPNTDYLASTVVKYNGLYYSAKKNIQGARSFDFNKWTTLNKKPTGGLLPNFDYKISQFNDFYSLDIDNFDERQQTSAQHLTGYITRPYLNNIFSDQISQYKFYQGYIREKGTSNAIAKLATASLPNLGSEVGYREEWAFRVGHYGSFTTTKEFEAPMQESVFVENPQIVTFVTKDNVVNDTLINQVTPDQLTIGTGTLPEIITTTSSDDAFKLIHAGYVRIDDVDATAYNLNSILDIANNHIINDGTTIWLGFTPNGSWDVLRYTFHSASVVNAEIPQADGTMKFTTSMPHGLTVTQFVSVVNFTDESDGIYQILSVPTVTEFIVATPLNFINQSPPDNAGFLFTFESSRFPTFDNLPSDQKLYRYKNGSFIWVDKGNGTDNNGWAVYEKVLNYTSSSTSEISTPAYAGLGFSMHRPTNQPYVLIGSPTYSDNGNAKSGGAGLYRSINNSLEPIVRYQMNNTPGNGNELGYSVFYDDVKFKNSSYGLMFAGAPGSYNNSGTVRISSINNVVSEQIQTWITHVTTATDGRFGSSIFVQRNTATKFTLISAPNQSSVGRIYAYSINATTSTVTSTYIKRINPNNPSLGNLTPGSQWGHAIVGNDNASVVAISAPYHANSGTVQVFYNITSSTYNSVSLISSSTFATPGAQFGKSLALSHDSQLLAVGAPGVTNIDGSFGAVGIFTATNGTYVLQQIITNPVIGPAMNFGQAIDFDVNTSLLTISALGTNKTVYTTFDAEDTTLDLTTTRFIEEEPASGSVYVYSKRGNRYVYAEELVNAVEAITSGTDYGTSVSIDNSTIIVGAPGISGRIISNVYQFTSISNYDGGWDQVRVQDNLVLPDAIKEITLINTVTNDIVNYYDYVDPLKGKILGIAEAELTYKMPSDPAIYSVGVAGVNVNGSANWVDNHVGELWWDLSTAKYIWYEQGNLEFRRSNWNKLFPGSSIDVYEWVESTLLPSDWSIQADTPAGLTQGISGQPKNVDNSIVSVKQVYDHITNSFSNVYYFWVKNKTTVPNVANRKTNAYTVASYIADPTGSGIQHVSVISSNTVMLSNLGSILVSDDISLNLKIDNTFNTVPKHTEWALLSHGANSSNTPTLIEKKIIDSLVGHDLLGNAVPDPTLSERSKYGTGVRPQQTLFKNRFTALRNIIEYANSVLITIPVISNYSVPKLASAEPYPTQYLILESADELPLIDTASTATVTVISDSTYNGGWTVYSYNPVKSNWERVRTQSYNTSLYFSLVDWKSPKFNPYQNIKTQLGSLFELTGPYEPGDYIKVSNRGNGNYIIVEQVNIAMGQVGTFGNNFNIVYEQNGTFQINNSIWDRFPGWDETYSYNQTLFDQTPDKEIRILLDVLKNDIFINDLQYHWNNLFFTAVKYAITEHPSLDWVFKTSFINVTNFAGKLNQPPIYKLADSNFYETYIKEVKPYHTQIRKFTTQYEATDTSYSSISDFDFPTYYDADKKSFVSPTVLPDTVRFNPVREMDTTLVFDRVGIRNQMGRLSVTDTFIGDGATLIFPLSWVAQADKSKIVVTITGQYILPSNYTIDYYTENYNGYNKSYSSLKFLDATTPPAIGTTISVTYHKSSTLMNAVERIDAYYKPTLGMPGFNTLVGTLTQLMVGAEDSRTQFGGLYEGKYSASNTSSNIYSIASSAYNTNTVVFDTLISGGAYSTITGLINALGVDPRELVVDGGNNFISTPSGPAPEEILPGFTADTLGIDVYTRPTKGSSPVVLIYSQFVVFRGGNVAVPMTTMPTTSAGMIVTFGNVPLDYVPYDRFTHENQYSIDWFNKSLIIPDQASPVGIITYRIFGVGTTSTNELGILDNVSVQASDAAGARFTSTQLISLASIHDVGSAYVTNNGVPVTRYFDPQNPYTPHYNIEVANGENSRAAAVVYWNTTTQIGDHALEAWFFNTEHPTFNSILSQGWDYVTDNAGIPLPIQLFPNSPDLSYGPPSDQVIVEAYDQNGVPRRLRPPYTRYYTVDSLTALNFPIYDLTNTNFISTLTNVNVYQNGVHLDPQVANQYNISGGAVNINSQSVTINVGDTIAIEAFNPIDITNSSTYTTAVYTATMSYSYDYALKYDAILRGYQLYLTPNYWNTTTNHIKITTFNNQDSLMMEQQSFVGNPNRTYKLDRPVVDPAYLWVTINTTSSGELILSNDLDYKILSDQRTILLSDVFVTENKSTAVSSTITNASFGGRSITLYDSVVVTSVANPAVSSENLAYRVFLPIANGPTQYRRISTANSTYLTTPLTSADTVIYVADSTVLTPPNASLNIPGVVLINGERIEFFQMDKGVLSQLRRGTYGTSPADYNQVSTRVIDQGTFQNIPGVDDIVFIQNTLTHTSNTLSNVYNISSDTIHGWWDSITSSTIQCDGIKLMTDTTSITYPSGLYPFDPYTGKIVFGKSVYGVSTASIAAKDQLEVYYGGVKLRKDPSYIHDTTVMYDGISTAQIVSSTSTFTNAIFPTFDNVEELSNAYFRLPTDQIALQLQYPAYITTDTNIVWVYNPNRSQSVINYTVSTKAELPTTATVGTTYLVEQTNVVYWSTGTRFVATATVGFVDSGLRAVPADFSIVTATQTLILNTATVKIHDGALLTIIMKQVGASWNDPDPNNTMTNTISILTSTNSVAKFLREGPAALPDQSFYGGDIYLIDNTGSPLTDENGNPLWGY